MSERTGRRAEGKRSTAEEWTEQPQPAYVGERLGLPQHGRGSLALWRSRLLALIVDWAISMAVAVAIFTPAVLTGHDWRRFMILTVFFVESALLSMLTGGSFGQLITRIAVMRLDGRTLGAPRAILRSLLVCLVVPALIIDSNRRGLHDILVGTVVINRR